jgi:hypothetical protein
MVKLQLRHELVKRSFRTGNVLLEFNFIFYITPDLSNINSMVSPQYLVKYRFVRTMIIVYPLAWSYVFAQVPLNSATILKKMCVMNWQPIRVQHAGNLNIRVYPGYICVNPCNTTLFWFFYHLFQGFPSICRRKRWPR